MKKPLKSLLDSLVPAVPDNPAPKKKKSMNLTEVKKAKYGDFASVDPPKRKYVYGDPQENTEVGASPLKRPFVQSNTLVTSAQEDSQAMNERDFEELPHTTQQLTAEQARPKGGRAPFQGGKGPSFNLGSGLALGMSALTAILPDQTTRKPLIEEPLAYNPYAYGTGSQAIMKTGGDLSPSKAREMLKDGTANGKKLSKKQKKYFGMVAAGKAEFGLETGDPTNPKFTNANQDAYYSSVLNNAILANAAPNTNEYGRSLASNKMGNLANAVHLFNQRPGISKLQGEDRINAFYNWNTGNPEVEEYKRKFKNINYAPAVDVRTAPLIPAPKMLAKMKHGGDLKSHNPYDGGTVEFSGPSHAEGGIDISVGGKQVEVEGGETAAQTKRGLTIFGNMTVPGSNKKFKTISKKLAEAERELARLEDNGVAAVTDVDFTSKNDKFKFNAGKVMMEGAKYGQQQVAEKKQILADLQRAMLDTAEEYNLDPEALSNGDVKKAKKGMWIPYKKKAQSGAYLSDDELNKRLKQLIGGAESGGKYDARNPTPGVTSFGKYQFTKATRKGVWERHLKKTYPTFEAFEAAYAAKPEVQEDVMSNHLNDLRKKYGDDPEAIALVHRLGPIGYQRVKKDPSLLDKAVSMSVPGSKDKETPREYLQKIVPTSPAPKVEAPVAYPEMFTAVLPKTKLTYQAPTTAPVEPVAPPELPAINIGERQPIPSNAEGLNPMQIVPEFIAFAQNEQEAVPLQTYQPTLFQPYQITLQDRINRNQGAFSQVARQAGNNPEALSILQSQLYEANNQVAAEQFRINQGISNDVTNKNVGILNDAELKNLQLSDTQYVRQSQAKSNTKAQTNVILNSIRDKFAQHNLQNRRLQAYENLYDYRFDENGQAQYLGPDASFIASGSPITSPNQGLQTTSEYDAQGNLKKTRTRKPSLLDQEIKKETLTNKQRKNFWDFMKK